MQPAVMPAVTLGQLQTALGTSSQNSTYFIEPGASFTSYVNEVGPRLYALGPWRDLLTERAHLGADGYISLDRDVDSVWCATVNDRPQKVRSMFHDMRMMGNSPFLPEQYGLVDLGEFSVKRDLTSIQNVPSYDDVTPVTTLHLAKENGSPLPFAGLAGAAISASGRTATGRRVKGVLAASGANAVITFAPGVIEIESLIGIDMAEPVNLLTDLDDEASCVAEIREGTDVVRYRRFRVGGAEDDTYVHLLVKRGWTRVASDSDLIHLGDLVAWKMALLCKVAEDNADVERSEYYWRKVTEVLDADLASYRGGAKPVMQLNLYGGAASGIRSLY